MACTLDDPSFPLELLHTARVQLPRVGTGGLVACVRQGLDNRLEVLLCAFGRTGQRDDQCFVPDAGHWARHHCN